MSLDVLLLGLADAPELGAAGHRLHTCFDEPAPDAHPSGWVACRALTAGECPLDGPIDVALVTDVHHPGLRCTARAHVPMTDSPTACEEVAAQAFAPVVERLRSVCAGLLRAHGTDPEDIDATFEVDGDQLAIRLSGPALPPRVQRALCDRAVDALRAIPRSFTPVDAGYRAR